MAFRIFLQMSQSTPAMLTGGSRTRRLTERNAASHSVQKEGGGAAVNRYYRSPPAARGAVDAEFALERAVETGEAVDTPAEGEIGNRAADVGGACEITWPAAVCDRGQRS
jgi:hypothetical protein